MRPIKKLQGSAPYVIKGLPENAEYWMLLVKQYPIRNLTALLRFGTETGGISMSTLAQDMEQVAALAIELCINRIFRALDFQVLAEASEYLLKANRGFPISRGHRPGLSFVVRCLEDLARERTPWHGAGAPQHFPSDETCVLFGTQNDDVERLKYGPFTYKFDYENGMLSEPFDTVRLNAFMKCALQQVRELHDSDYYKAALRKGEEWLKLRMRPFWQRIKAMEDKTNVKPSRT